MTETVYIGCATSKTDRLARICAIIDALELQMLANTANEPTEKYKLDDGQVIIETQYRSIKSMQDGIFALIQMKNRLLNELNGANFALRSWQGLRN